MTSRWDELTWQELGEAAEQGALALLPCGSVEQHGPALTLGTDMRLATRVADGAARIALDEHGVRTVVLPVLPYGLSEHHMNFPGTITLSSETYIRLASEILRCVVGHGFRRIGVISGHGGNNNALAVAVSQVAREYVNTRPVRIALLRSIFSDAEVRAVLERGGLADPPEPTPKGHADCLETSLLMADEPCRVRRDRVVKPAMKMADDPFFGWSTHEITESGCMGDPTRATEEVGEALWEAASGVVARFLKRLADAELPGT